MAGTKNNRRTQLTQEMLKRALLTLLNTHALGEISISSLCKEADINRGTFYRYYKSVPDFFQTIEEEMLREIESRVIGFTSGDFTAHLTVLIEILAEYGPLVRIQIRNSEESQLLAMIFSQIRSWSLKEISQTFHETNPQRLDYLFSFYVLGTGELIKKWIEENPEMPPSEMATILNKIYDTLR